MPDSSPRRRRYWSPNEKIRILEEAMCDETTIASIAKKYRLQPNQLHAWKRRMRMDKPNERRSVSEKKGEVMTINNADPTTVELRITITIGYEIIRNI